MQSHSLRAAVPRCDFFESRTMVSQHILIATFIICQYNCMNTVKDIFHNLNNWPAAMYVYRAFTLGNNLSNTRHKRLRCRTQRSYLSGTIVHSVGDNSVSVDVT